MCRPMVDPTWIHVLSHSDTYGSIWISLAFLMDPCGCHMDLIWNQRNPIWIHVDAIWISYGFHMIHKDPMAKLCKRKRGMLQVPSGLPWIQMDLLWNQRNPIWIHVDAIWISYGLHMIDKDPMAKLCKKIMVRTTSFWAPMDPYGSHMESKKSYMDPCGCHKDFLWPPHGFKKIPWQSFAKTLGFRVSGFRFFRV